MNFFSSSVKFRGEKTIEDGQCPCGAQPKLVRKLLDPRRGLTVRIFECQCGERGWTEDKQ
jgi:hypothetical protein